MNLRFAKKLNELFERANERDKLHKNIYNKANELLAVLGAEGVINTRHSATDALMNALHEFDGGQYDTKKMFPKDDYYKI